MKLPPNKQVLIVDDSKEMREHLISILNSLGVTKIVQAESVDKAKETLVAHYDNGGIFDLILCDHHMPGNVGTHFINFVRKDNKFSSISYITITSDSQRSVVLPYISAGADSFIVKPVSAEDLYNKISRVWKLTRT